MSVSFIKAQVYNKGCTFSVGRSVVNFVKYGQ